MEKSQTNPLNISYCQLAGWLVRDLTEIPIATLEQSKCTIVKIAIHLFVLLHSVHGEELRLEDR